MPIPIFSPTRRRAAARKTCWPGRIWVGCARWSKRYRRNNGLGAVSLDPQLMRMAESHAQTMASRDRLDHNVGGAFRQRVERSGYDAKTAVENISAGYHTLAEAFSGWRDSPPHRANMLKDGVTKMGIAAVYAPKSKYRVFWALVLAAPDDQKKSAR